MRRHRSALALTLATLLVSAAALAAAAQTTEKERVSKITNNLVCTCGCANLIVAKCGCGQAAEMTSEVAALVQKGASDAEIFQAFEKKYGPAVLGEPKAVGFNLLAWILPFVGLALGGATVVMVLRRLKPPDAAATAADEQAAAQPDEETRRLIDEELREY